MAENRQHEVVVDVSEQQQQQPIAFGRRDSIAESVQLKHKKNRQAAGDDDSRNFLLSLPGDIRNLIYQHVFFHPSGIHLHFGRGRANTKNSATLISAANLSLCNRQLNAESKALLYHLNAFHLHASIFQNDDDDDDDGSIHETAEATFPAHNSRNGNLPCRLPKTGEPHLHLSRNVARFHSLLASCSSPSAQAAVTHLSRALPSFPFPYLRHIELRLGSTREAGATSLPTFLSAWTVLASVLRNMRAKARRDTELRVKFDLRVSSRWVVAWDFGIEGVTTKAVMVKEIDAKLWNEVKTIVGMLTIGELENVNKVRRQVVETFFEWQGMKYWQGVGRGSK